MSAHSTRENDVTRVRLTWTILAILYALFFNWYTACGGPLTPAEIEHYTALFAEQGDGTTPERAAILKQFMETDTGDDFVMVNVIDMHDTPLRIEGVEPGQTSDEVLGRYMEYMYPALFKRASHPVFFGRAAAPAMEMFGIEGVRDWTQGAGMRYRSRRDLLEIATNPAFSGPHEFKVAAMEKTFAFPVDPWFHLGDPRLLLALACLIVGLAVTAFSGRGAPGDT